MELTALLSTVEEKMIWQDVMMEVWARTTDVTCQWAQAPGPTTRNIKSIEYCLGLLKRPAHGPGPVTSVLSVMGHHFEHKLLGSKTFFCYKTQIMRVCTLTGKYK